jgi:hypothetical protein
MYFDSSDAATLTFELHYRSNITPLVAHIRMRPVNPS